MTQPSTSEASVGGVAGLLRSLLAIGMALVVVGAAVSWAREGLLPAGTASLDTLLGGVARFDGASLATLGVLVLLATPRRSWRPPVPPR